MPMKFLVAHVRAVRLFVHIFYGLALACVYPSFGIARRRSTMQQWSTKLLQILNVQLHCQGQHASPGAVGQLLLANHISWLDVFVISATVPARFVAKSEVGNWPLFGVLVRRTGTLFIRRAYRRDTARINQALGNCLLGGEDVVVFPQGTSTDGTQPVHFHSALVQGAIDVGAEVRPVALAYHDGQGEPLHDVAFTGEMTFAQSLWKILCVPRINASTVYLAELHGKELTRREATLGAQGAINAVLSSARRLQALPLEPSTEAELLQA